MSFIPSNLNRIDSDRIPDDLTVLRRAAGQPWSISIFFSDPLTGTFVSYNANFAGVSQRVTISTIGASLLFGIGELVMAAAVARRK